MSSCIKKNVYTSHIHTVHCAVCFTTANDDIRLDSDGSYGEDPSTGSSKEDRPVLPSVREDAP